MRFTNEQMEKVIESLNEKTPGRCPACGHEELDVQPFMAIIPLYSALSFPLMPTLAEGVQPNLVTICKGCGNTQLFNIHVLGLAEILGIPPPTGWEEK